MKIVDWFIYYEDKGPSGPCGQDVHTTSHWRELYKVQCTYGRVREICKGLLEARRMSPQIELFCCDKEEAEKVGHTCVRTLSAMTGRES